MYISKHIQHNWFSLTVTSVGLNQYLKCQGKFKTSPSLVLFTFFFQVYWCALNLRFAQRVRPRWRSHVGTTHVHREGSKREKYSYASWAAIWLNWNALWRGGLPDSILIWLHPHLNHLIRKCWRPGSTCRLATCRLTLVWPQQKIKMPVTHSDCTSYQSGLKLGYLISKHGRALQKLLF